MNRPKTSTSSTTPVFSTDQQSMQHNLSDMLGARMANPGDVFAGQKVGAIDSVNRSYGNLEERLKTQFAGRGMGRSGRLVTNTRALESQRIGDIGSLDAKFAGMQRDYEDRLVDQAMRFSFASPGSRGTSTGPGNVAGGALGGGLETATMLYGLNRLLSGGGGGGSMGSGETSSESWGLPTADSYGDWGGEAS